MSVSLDLTKIYCVTTSEPGHDELFLTYRIDDGDEIRVPAQDGDYYPIEAGKDWPLNLRLTFNTSLVVTLWDEDNWPSTSDYLGQAKYTPDNLPHETTVSGSSGQYKVYIVKL
jgi:hypothetical protein